MSKNAYIKLIVISTILIIVAISLFIVSTIKKTEKTNSISKTVNTDSQTPSFLYSSFPNTNWSKVDPIIYKALDGGPGKDGIPAIDTPKFIPIEKSKSPDSAQAIVIKDNNKVKVYPYNILIWHEIINDTVNGTPISVTFCPLCESAVVYNRNLPDGITTFGVSGALVESNMIMYDKLSETLWQQSTGEAIAGKYLGTELKREQFQLLTIKEIKTKYKNSFIVSTDTGYRRDYQKNPYGEYNESDDFIFSPSKKDNHYPAKTIFVVFKIKNTSIATPWLTIKEGKTYQTEVNDNTITLHKGNKELIITDKNGTIIPFYFEMWFSFAVQHQDDGIIFDPNKN